MLAWNESFTTGLESIDTQHKLLIDHINRLEEILANPELSPSEVEFATSLVQFLESYADTHFKLEEKCMERYRCPAHDKNKSAHGDFLSFIAGFKEQYKSQGFSVQAFKELHHTMSTWIIGHILQIDTQLNLCIKH